MSALSSSPVAFLGNSAQAAVQPGAPDAVADTSPFALLLAAIAAADPALQAAVQQPGVIPAEPVDGEQSLIPSGLKPANDDGADAVDTTIETDTDGSQSLPADPDVVAASKSGKPEKKNSADKATPADVAAIPPASSQMPVMPQLPIAPVTQAAVQTQTVAGTDQNEDQDASAPGGITATSAPATASPGIKPANPPVTPGPNTSQPASSQPAQTAANPMTPPPVAPPLSAAQDDDSGDDLLSSMAAMPAAKPAAGSAKPAESRNSSSKPADQTAPQPQTSAAPADDADMAVAPPASQVPAATQATTAAQAIAASPQPSAETAQQVLESAFVAQQPPPKSVKETADKPAPDKTANPVLPPVSDVAANAADPARNMPVSPAAASDDNNSVSKPAHNAAPAAPPPQLDAPQPAAQPIPNAIPPQNFVAIGAASASASGVTLSVHVADHTANADPAPASSVAPNIDALAVSVAARSLGGAKQFDIRLDPPELGRVEVRLSIDAGGKTQAHMTADQPQTLALLQKDAPNLTRALRDAGLDVSQNGLNFSLKGQSQNGGGQSGNFGSASRGLSLPAIAQSIDAAQPAGISSSLPGTARLDIHV